MAEAKTTVREMLKLIITTAMEKSHPFASDMSDYDNKEEDKTNEDSVHLRHMHHHQKRLDTGHLPKQTSQLNLDFPIDSAPNGPVADRIRSLSIKKRLDLYGEQCQNQVCCAEEPFTNENCRPLKRIRAVLDIYHKLTNDKSKWNAISTQKQIRSHKDINDDQYGHQQLFDDFSHLKLVHIDPDNKKRWRDPKDKPIVRELCDTFKDKFPCDMKECRAFLNHYRDRVGQELPDTEDTVFQQEFYKIHSYFFHSTIQFGTCETCYHEQMEIDKLINNAAIHGSTRFSKSYDIHSDEKEIPSEDDAGAQYSYVGKKQDDEWWKDVSTDKVDVKKRIS
eukprot:455572_1